MPNTLKEAKYQDTKTANTLADFVMTIGNQVSLNISSVLNKGKISFPQFFILACLANEESLTMTDIAKKMGHSTAAATGLVDRLEKLGFVERMHSAEDRRKVFVRITAQGIEFMSKMRKEIQNELSDIIANIDYERAEIVEATRASIKNICPNSVS